VSPTTGFYMPLSLPRRLMTDFLHFSARVPTVPVERRMDLGAVARARAAASPRPGWTALFVKAWGLVCARRAPLRRSFVKWPWDRLYQHRRNVASVAVERPYGEEEALFFHHLREPEGRSLIEIDRRLKDFRDGELGSSAAARRQLRVAALPRPLRRLLLGAALNVGRWRERFVGTYGVSGYGQLGASSLHPLSVTTTTVNFGPIGDDGGVDVRVIYDHRVVDGATVARAMADLEGVFNAEILAELRYLRDVTQLDEAA
jgi:hypothetical protein